MSGKSQKFDRNRKRSKSMQAYNAGRRDKVNKTKKLQRHLKVHSTDKQAAAALKQGTGPRPSSYAPKNKPPVHEQQPHRMDQLVKEDNSKHMVLFAAVTVPDNAMLTITPFISQAFKAFSESKAKVDVRVRTAGRWSVLKSKAAVPVGKPASFIKL